MGRLHRLVDHGHQLSREGVEVDLVAEATAECLDRSGCVVAAPVEAPVHSGLDAATDGPEDRGRGQGGGGHQPARRVRPGPATRTNSSDPAA